MKSAKNFKLITVVGTRPELIRLSLIIKKLDLAGINHILVHTHQNYHPLLYDIFLKGLNIRTPDYILDVKAETAGAQIGNIIKQTETVFIKEKPDAVLILGDTNSALASISATRLGIPIFHMEAGNRAYYWRGHEEKNRKIVDHISDWLFPYTMRSRENLLREGINPSKIFITGNPIREVLKYFEPQIAESPILKRTKLRSGDYFLVTMHREENVDDPSTLKNIIKGLALVVNKYRKKMLLMVHPRTDNRLKALRLHLPKEMELHEPLGFFDFAHLEQHALCLISDSGTVPEEGSLMKVPTVIIREATERPEVVECGAAIVSGTRSPENVLKCVSVMLNRNRDFKSPYANDLDVSDKMLQYILAHKL